MVSPDVERCTSDQGHQSRLRIFRPAATLQDEPDVHRSAHGRHASSTLVADLGARIRNAAKTPAARQQLVRGATISSTNAWSTTEPRRLSSPYDKPPPKLPRQLSCPRSWALCLKSRPVTYGHPQPSFFGRGRRSSPNVTSLTPRLGSVALRSIRLSRRRNLRLNEACWRPDWCWARCWCRSYS